MMARFSDLKGKTIIEICGLEKGSDSVEFVLDDGSVYAMAHEQDCCEVVEIEEIFGDADCLIGQPVLVAEERISDAESPEDDEYKMWTFYTLATVKGYVDIRWCGTSNGWYSVSVDFKKIK